MDRSRVHDNATVVAVEESRNHSLGCPGSGGVLCLLNKQNRNARFCRFLALEFLTLATHLDAPQRCEMLLRDVETINVEADRCSGQSGGRFADRCLLHFDLWRLPDVVGSIEILTSHLP